MACRYIRERYVRASTQEFSEKLAGISFEQKKAVANNRDGQLGEQGGSDLFTLTKPAVPAEITSTCMLKLSVTFRANPNHV